MNQLTIPVLSEPSPLRDMLDRMRESWPIGAVVEVGAGDGEALLPYQKWGAKRVTLIEAREHDWRRLSRRISGLQGWTAVHATVDSANGQRRFHHASNPAESGLVAPDALSALWRNLKSVRDHDVVTTTIDAILSAEFGTQSPASAPNWLLVDCLPPLPILEGAGDWLNGLDLLVVRTVDTADGAGMEACGREAVDAYLAGLGFWHVESFVDLHPGLSRDVYVRDWKSILSSTRTAMQEALREQTRLREASQEHMRELELQRRKFQQLETTAQEEREAHRQQARVFDERSLSLAIQMVGPRQELARKHVDLQRLAALVTQLEQRETSMAAQLLAQAQALSQSEARCAESTQRAETVAQDLASTQSRVASLQQELRHQEGFAATLRESLTALSVERDECTRALDAQSARIASLLQELRHQEGVAATLQESLTARSAERDERAHALDAQLARVASLTQTVEEREQRIRSLEQQQAELESRQRLLDQEVVRAEAQIELIKSVVLREKAF